MRGTDMRGHYKKLFSITIAILIGVGVILFAWKGDLLFSTKVPNETTNNEWKDSLSVVPSVTQILAAHGGGATYTKSGSATTSTDVLAHNLLTNYAIVQGGMATTTWSEDDANAFAQTLVDQVKLPEGVQYSVKDLHVSNDNSVAALTAYSKEIAKILSASAAQQTKGDTEIVFAAPGTNDTARLAAISKLVARYQKLKKDLLAVQVPSDIAPLHVRLVQGYANIGDSVKIMPEIFTDPVKGFAALTQYKQEVEGLLILSGEYANALPKTP